MMNWWLLPVVEWNHFSLDYWNVVWGLVQRNRVWGGGGLWVFLLLISIKFLIRIITPWDLRLVDFL